MREEILKCDICCDDLRKKSFNSGSAYTIIKQYSTFKRWWMWSSRQEESGEYVICGDCIVKIRKYMSDKAIVDELRSWK